MAIQQACMFGSGLGGFDVTFSITTGELGFSRGYLEGLFGSISPNPTLVNGVKLVRCTTESDIDEGWVQFITPQSIPGSVQLYKDGVLFCTLASIDGMLVGSGPTGWLLGASHTMRLVKV